MRTTSVRRATVALALGIAIGLGAVSPASACACGIAIEAEVKFEEALVSWDGRREVATVKLDLEGAGRRAAVLFPVPAEPHVDQLSGRTDAFGYLKAATSPPAPEDASGDGEDSSRAPGAGVEVVERRVIGGYDVAVLRADDEGALLEWLRSNRYSVTEAADAILDEYVERRWHFVAIKLAESRDGSLRPLRMAFDARRPVYPMELSRASRAPVSLRLYVNAKSPVSTTGITGLEPVFDSPVKDLDPPPPSDVRRLLPQPHLTRLELTGASPQSIRGDVRIRTASIAGSDEGSPSTLGWIAIVAGILGGLAVGIAWRRRRAATRGS